MKRVIILLCILCIGLVFAGCDSETTERFLAAEEQGLINAVNYVREKYGFEPEVVKAEGKMYASGILPPVYYPEEPIKVTMRHQGKEFLVHITGTEATTDGVDDYQSEEINAAIETGVQAIFRGYGQYAHVKVTDLPDNYHTFYDGTNVEQLIKEAVVDCYYVTAAGMDLESLDTDALMDRLGADRVEIVNFTDPAGCDEIVQLGDMELERFVRWHEMNLEDYMVLGADGTREYHQVEKIRCGALTVVPHGASYCNVTQIENNLQQWQSNLELEGELRAHYSYCIETDATDLFLAIERSALEETEISGTFLFGEKCIYGEGISYDGCPCALNGVSYYTWSNEYGNFNKTMEYCFLEHIEPEEEEPTTTTAAPSQPNMIRCGDLLIQRHGGTHCDVTPAEVDLNIWSEDLELSQVLQTFGGYTIETDARGLEFYYSKAALDQNREEGTQIIFADVCTAGDESSHEYRELLGSGDWYLTGIVIYPEGEKEITCCILESEWQLLDDEA